MRFACLFVGHVWRYIGIYWEIPGPVWICSRCQKCHATHDPFFAETSRPAGGSRRTTVLKFAVSTDAELKAAIRACMTGGGGTIHLLPDVMRRVSPLELPDNTSLVGRPAPAPGLPPSSGGAQS